MALKLTLEIGGFATKRQKFVLAAVLRLPLPAGRQGESAQP
jgi:hypothetical protein